MIRKKIGVIIGSLTHDFSRRVCRAISKRAEEYGFDVYFFTTFNAYDDSLLYGEGEQQIFSLPDYSSLTGIIVALDTLNIRSADDSLLKRLRSAGCPVVALRMYSEGFYNVLVDETTSMERMIRHFVDVHKFRDICFVTGRMDLEDAQGRYACYRRVMEECGIPITENMVFYGDYWKKKGKEIVDFFLESRVDRFPEAIVCANDYMAVSVCMELERRGIRVPEDICVSGYDDLEEANRSTPSLTSIAVSFEDMAIRAVDLIDEIDRGEKPDKIQYVDVKEKYRESCGCNRHKVKFDWGSLMTEIEDRKEITRQTLFMNVDLEGVTDEKVLLNTVHNYGFQINAKKMWICLCDDSEELTEEERNLGSTRMEYTNQMVLRAIKSPSGALHLLEKKFDRRELIPEEERREIESGSFYFVSLHYKNHNLGYVATTYENYGHYNDFMQSWALNFAVALENYSLYRHLNAMQHIKHLYKEDSLTGILNRRGFEEQAKKLYSEAVYYKYWLAVVSIDMDNLKLVNDGYGHQAGDDALCRVARALENVDGENKICARMGGDEFCLMCRIEKEGEGEQIIHKIREAVSLVNEEAGTQYTAEVSCGVCEVTDAGVIALRRALQLSDERMYADKRQRKAGREA